MSLIKLQGNPSGTGAFTIAAPNGNTDRTLTLPDATGTVVTADGSGNIATTSITPSSGIYLGGTGSANLLDDYEEGTWTPTLVSTSASFTYPRGQYGTYTKVGDLVVAQFYIGADASGTTTNACFIGSLPFTSKNINVLAQFGATAWVSRPEQIGFTVQNSSTYITLWDQNNGATQLNASQVAGGYIVGHCVYKAD